ncbi:chymotrypsin-1-like [Colias croceus]|uniref:chymotrypsin-1-like n=1 Tax=Colias crocea TaxID=72248 RepID=UPI001E2808BD|nr:chymotrypsin-1-like [Colias croceus]
MERNLSSDNSYIFVLGDSRIVGGDNVEPGFGKFHASLQNLDGHHVCGGAVISHRHVVTAAHCLVGAHPRFIKVVVGTENLDIGGLQYDVRAIYIHENYNTSLRLHDIAVLKVSGLFDLQRVDMIRMDRDELQENDIVIVTGFGADEPKGSSSRKMQKLQLPVFNQKTCRFAMRYARKVFDTMFCTFTRIGEGTCHGDSGGPLIKNNKLVGLVSWGIPCGSGFPDVHTRINFYIEWIEGTLEKSIKKCCRNEL